VDSIDPILDGLKLQSSVFSRMELGLRWGFSKEPIAGAPFHIVLEGEAWLKDGRGELQRVGPGDMATVPRGTPYQLLSTPDAYAVPFRQVMTELGLEDWKPGDRIKPVLLRMGDVGERPTKMISGVFDFADRRTNPLLVNLPDVLILRATDSRTAPGARPQEIGRMISDEIEADNLGANLVAGRLADYLFVQSVRAHLVGTVSSRPGWLRGLRDPSIGRSLAMMHADPRRQWSVVSLAQEVGMSRSQFADQFKRHVGKGPIEYLTEWRMYEAAGSIEKHELPIKEIAQRAGYKSTTAFGKAFKRWAGASPASTRRPTGDASETSST